MNAKPRVLLVYIGFEQGAWGSIAHPKAEHFYIMPGILYCAAALRAHALTRDNIEVECLYLNKTAQSIDAMLQEISVRHPQVLGFSAFCWNIDVIQELADRYRQTVPDSIIVLGGPEITMRDSNEAQEFFAKSPGTDALVFGEAEEKLPIIIHSLINPQSEEINGAKGFAFSPRFGALQNYDASPVDLDALPSPYPFEISIKRSPTCGLAMVYETRRGCPYRCIYCQFGHREQRMRSFDLDRVEKELAWLLSINIDCLHFADPVFDLEPDRAKRLLRFIIEHNISTSLFFYCSFLKLDHELAQLFEQSQCQIGVGVQSSNPVVLKKIQRTLSPRLFDSIRELLVSHHINFYTDLIFGLPEDSMSSFEKSFNDCIELNPSFVMLFPLTLIKRTTLEENAQSYGMMQYDKEAISRYSLMCDIEYQHTALFRNFTVDQLELFDDMALTCFYFYNRFRYSLAHLQQRTSGNVARLYQNIGRKTKEYLKRIGQKPSNTNPIPGFQDEILRIFNEILKDCGAGAKELKAFGELFKLDIYRIIILNGPQRRRIFENARRFLQKTNQQSSNVESFVMNTYGKKIALEFPLDQLKNLAMLREGIAPIKEMIYLHAPFSRWDASAQVLTPLEDILLERIPADRPVRIASLISTINKGRRDETTGDKEIYQALGSFCEKDIIRRIA